MASVVSHAGPPSGRGGNAAPRGPHAPAGGPSLDKRTNFDDNPFVRPKTFNFKQLIYPNGDAEIVATPKRSKTFRKRMERFDPETGEILEKKPEKSTTELVEARNKSLSRTKTGVRRAIMGMAATHMLTLTYRDNMTDLKQGWKDVSCFLRAMRDALGEYAYVIVAEQQKRGAWHFHLAVRGKQDLKLVRKHWSHGNPDAQHWKGRLSQMASYMSKYLVKSFYQRDREDGHRYRCSQAAPPRPIVISVEAHSSADVRHIMRYLFEECGLIGFANFEGGKGTAGHYVWGCTWLDPSPD